MANRSVFGARDRPAGPSAGPPINTHRRASRAAAWKLASASRWASSITSRSNGAQGGGFRVVANFGDRPGDHLEGPAGLPDQLVGPGVGLLGPPAGELQLPPGGDQLGVQGRRVGRIDPGLPERAGGVGLAGLVGRGLPVELGDAGIQFGPSAGDLGVEEAGPLGLVLLAGELPVGRQLLPADGDLGQGGRGRCQLALGLGQMGGQAPSNFALQNVGLYHRPAWRASAFGFRLWTAASAA